ncbi:hypothetical protein V6N13_073730 [Hibiscus sabdariffa]
MLVSEKVVAIQTWSTPTIVKEVWQEQCRLQGNKLGLSSVYHDDPTFLKAWNQINDPIRPLDNPLRSPFQDVYKIDGIATIIVGHVETGVLKHGMIVTIGPTSLTMEAKSVEMQYESPSKALPDDNVGFNVKNVVVHDLKRVLFTSKF